MFVFFDGWIRTILGRLIQGSVNETKYQIIISMLNTRTYFSIKILIKLHFKVLYRRVLFVMSIIYYFGEQNRRIPWATASKT